MLITFPCHMCMDRSVDRAAARSVTAAFVRTTQASVAYGADIPHWAQQTP